MPQHHTVIKDNDNNNDNDNDIDNDIDNDNDNWDIKKCKCNVCDEFSKLQLSTVPGMPCYNPSIRIRKNLATQQ